MIMGFWNKALKKVGIERSKSGVWYKDATFPSKRDAKTNLAYQRGIARGTRTKVSFKVVGKSVYYKHGKKRKKKRR